MQLIRELAQKDTKPAEGSKVGRNRSERVELETPTLLRPPPIAAEISEQLISSADTG